MAVSLNNRDYRSRVQNVTAIYKKTTVHGDLVVTGLLIGPTDADKLDGIILRVSLTESDIASLKTRMTTVESDIANLGLSSSQIAALTDRVVILEGTAGDHAVSLASILSRITGITRATDTTTLTGNLTVTGDVTVTGTLTFFDPWLKALGDRVKDLENGYDGIASTVAGFSVALALVETQVSAHGTAIAANSSAIAGVSGTVQGHTSELLFLDQAVTSLETRMSTAEGTIIALQLSSTDISYASQVTTIANAFRTRGTMIAASNIVQEAGTAALRTVSMDEVVIGNFLARPAMMSSGPMLLSSTPDIMTVNGNSTFNGDLVVTGTFTSSSISSEFDAITLVLDTHETRLDTLETKTTGITYATGETTVSGKLVVTDDANFGLDALRVYKPGTVYPAGFALVNGDFAVGGSCDFNAIVGTSIATDSATISGPVTCTTLTASGAISGSSISASSANVTGSVTCDDVSATLVTGLSIAGTSVDASSMNTSTISASTSLSTPLIKNNGIDAITINSAGAVTIPTLSITDLVANSVSTPLIKNNGISAITIDSAGAVTIPTLSSTTVTASTSLTTPLIKNNDVSSITISGTGAVNVPVSLTATTVNGFTLASGKKGATTLANCYTIGTEDNQVNTFASLAFTSNTQGGYTIGSNDGSTVAYKAFGSGANFWDSSVGYNAGVPLPSTANDLIVQGTTYYGEFLGITYTGGGTFIPQSLIFKNQVNANSQYIKSVVVAGIPWDNSALVLLANYTIPTPAAGNVTVTLTQSLGVQSLYIMVTGLTTNFAGDSRARISNITWTGIYQSRVQQTVYFPQSIEVGRDNTVTRVLPTIPLTVHGDAKIDGTLTLTEPVTGYTNTGAIPVAGQIGYTWRGTLASTALTSGTLYLLSNLTLGTGVWLTYAKASIHNTPGNFCNVTQVQFYLVDSAGNVLDQSLDGATTHAIENGKYISFSLTAVISYEATKAYGVYIRVTHNGTTTNTYVGDAAQANFLWATRIA